ncbi:MAG: triphosphoribosyl-dephospho-CoA synthase [Bacteroidota bacterium]|nr:triphosphoribosyl-dephospho-CoA synthase [Bacteroidota bacterium]
MSLEKILSAKEQRAEMRQKFAQKGFASISLSLNIPSYPKSNEEIKKFFLLIKTELEDYFLAHRILLVKQEEITLTDSAGDFFIVPIASQLKDILKIKALCELFEIGNSLGRIIDIDVVDSKGNPVSSGKLKKCFLCDLPAIECMRNANHTKQELRNYIEKQIVGYLYRDKLKNAKTKLSAYATQSLLYEVSLSPKPGLVHRFGSGCHTDMDFFSFINSSSVLSTYWQEIIELAYNTTLNIEESRIVLRKTGIAMERSMLQFTGKVNTQKGAIFIIGTMVFVIAKLIASDKEICDKNIRALIAELHKDILHDELLRQKNSVASHGVKNYRNYGEENGGGIRKEVALGFPVLFDDALPVIRGLMNGRSFILNEETTQRILTKILLKIISKNSDSNIIFRSDVETLKQLQNIAKECFYQENEFVSNYNELQDFCINKNISPGGSADLLAATIFIYQTQQNL